MRPDEMYRDLHCRRGDLRILRSDEVAIGPADRVFRHSSVRDGFVLIAILAGGVATGAAVWFGALSFPVAALALAFLAMFGFVAFRMYTRSASPENWLLAWDGSRVLIKLRSHLNAETAEDRFRVLDIAAADIVGFRVTESTTQGHGASGEPESDRSTFLELLLRDECVELAEAIRAERERRPRGSVWRHYPVTLPDARTLRLEWRGKHARITPRIAEVTSLLGQFIPALESTAAAIDLGTSGAKPVNADVEREIRLLADQGRIFDATVLAVRTYGVSQAEARQMVERLASRSAPRLPRQNDGSAV